MQNKLKPKWECKNVDNTEAVNTVEWFFGYGGNHIGLERAGVNMRLLALCEIEEFAIQGILEKMEDGRLPPAPIWSNCKTFPREPFKNRVDLFIASYPCQPFSSAGKRLGDEDPRHLWPCVYEFVRNVRPTKCFFENVEGHVTKGLQEVVEDLEGIGYEVSWGIFSAAEVGAPHQRKRVFILAHSKDRRNIRGQGEVFGENEKLSSQKKSRENQRPKLDMHGNMGGTGSESGVELANRKDVG